MVSARRAGVLFFAGLLRVLPWAPSGIRAASVTRRHHPHAPVRPKWLRGRPDLSSDRPRFSSAARGETDAARRVPGTMHAGESGSMTPYFAGAASFTMPRAFRVFGKPMMGFSTTSVSRSI